MKLLTKTTNVFLSAVAVIVISAACQTDNTSKMVLSLQYENDSLVTAINERDSLMNVMIDGFSEIEENLSFIREQRNMISVTSDNPELEQNRKDKIVQDVKDMATLLDESRKRINTLNKKLKKSGIKIASLEKKMADLDESFKTRNSEVLALTNELEQKNYEIGVLAEEIQVLETNKVEQNMIIKVQESELDDLNRAYFTLGTSKELKEKGLVTKEGGFLGLGKSKTVNTNIDENQFSAIDIRETKSIPVDSDKAELITEHPSGSYEFVTDTTNHIEVLAINNPDEFYKFSKYVVLEVK